MNTNSIRKIAFAGSGNVAWHLASALHEQGYQLTGIWSRDANNAARLAERCNSLVCTDISRLKEGADLIIIAVPDKAIGFIAASIGTYDGIVVHTAGSVSVDILKTHFKSYGSFYPLQTFTKEMPVSPAEIPFFLEASSDSIMHSIKELAFSLSPKIYEADSRTRLLLHVAAVFAGNYSNLMYIIGNELLKNAGLPVEVLNPLMLETTRKAVAGDPRLAQTGPARRGDTPTIEKHINALASFPEYAELYRLLAELIAKQYTKA